MGIAVAMMLLIGGIIVSGALTLGRTGDRWRANQTQSTLTSIPADRYHSRGILPLQVDPELGDIEVYLVNDDGSLHPPPHGLRQEIWDLALNIVTSEEAPHLIKTYQVGDDPESLRTAWVIEHGERDGEWILGVNLATSTDPMQLTATLIHEYAHLLSLRGGQVVPPGDDCTTVLLPEGCAVPGSYLDAFSSAFWADYGTDAPAADNADTEVAHRFYQTHPGAFVSEYAAMNLPEDFAESFTAYLHADSAIPPQAFNGKIAFFDRFKQTVSIRDRIRTTLGDTIGTFNFE